MSAEDYINFDAIFEDQNADDFVPMRASGTVTGRLPRRVDWFKRVRSDEVNPIMSPRSKDALLKDWLGAAQHKEAYDSRCRLAAFRLSVEGYAIVRSGAFTSAIAKLPKRWKGLMHGDQHAHRLYEYANGVYTEVANDIARYMYASINFVDPRDRVDPLGQRRTQVSDILKVPVGDLRDIELRVINNLSTAATLAKELVVDLSQVPAHKAWIKKHQEDVLGCYSFRHDVAMGWSHRFSPIRMRSKEFANATYATEQDTPYTIKEHRNVANNRIMAITVGRTVSKDYQSRKMELTLEVDNDQDLDKINKLGKAMVDTMLGVRRLARAERVELNEFGRGYFGDRDFDVSDLSSD